MAELYADENVAFGLVTRLRERGHDVLTALEDGRAGFGIGDPDVLARATELGRAVLTNSRDDFHRLHRLGSDHDALADRIDAAVSALPDLAGQLVRVTRPNPPATF